METKRQHPYKWNKKEYKSGTSCSPSSNRLVLSVKMANTKFGDLALQYVLTDEKDQEREISEKAAKGDFSRNATQFQCKSVVRY